MHILLRSLAILGTGLATGHSAVIWSGVRDIGLPTTLNGISVHLATGVTTTAPDPDFETTDINFFFGGDGILTGSRLLPARSAPGAVDPIIPATIGMPVDESLNYGPVGFGASQAHVGPGPAQFPSGEEGYISFQYDPTQSGDYSFGWMRVTLTSGASAGTLHEWAYSDTPGETVLVGTVPEPQAIILAGLSLLLMAGRRR